MKLSFCDPDFALFASDELDDTDDDEPTVPNLEPPPASEPSPFRDLVSFASEVRIRAAARAEKVAQRRRGA